MRGKIVEKGWIKERVCEDGDQVKQSGWNKMYLKNIFHQYAHTSVYFLPMWEQTPTFAENTNMNTDGL